MMQSVQTFGRKVREINNYGYVLEVGMTSADVMPLPLVGKIAALLYYWRSHS